MTSPTKHEWTADWCALAERVLHGRAADALLADEASLSHDAALVVLPQWRWREPVTDIGRKGRASDGSLLQFPMRVTWSAPLVLLRSGTSTKGTWHAAGLGAETEGRLSVATSTGPVSTRRTPTVVEVEALDEDVPSHVVATVMAAERVRDTLQDLSVDGHEAWWQMQMQFEGMVRHHVNKAHVSLSMDVAGSELDAPPLMDALDVDALVNLIMFHPGKREPTPALTRVLERAMRPEQVMKSDPLYYIALQVRGASWAAVKDFIGDPNDGSKIRAIARELETVDVEAVAAEWARRYPKDSELGTRRWEAAMRVAALPTAGGDKDVAHL